MHISTPMAAAMAKEVIVGTRLHVREQLHKPGAALGDGSPASGLGANLEGEGVDV